MNRMWRGIVNRLGRLATRRPTARTGTSPTTSAASTSPTMPTTTMPTTATATTATAARRRQLIYSPKLDGRADPGEIVWTWVPYEDDPRHGKDRPVLVVGREESTLDGLMLSSNSERDGQRHWFALGQGAWDREQRPSWVRLDRVLTVDEDGIRREGAVLDRRRFDAIAAELRRHYGWS